MAKKTIDKNTKVTTTKTIEDTPVVSEQKEENVVNLEKVDDTEDKKDVSEVIAPENISENVEKVDAPENAEPLDKPEAPAEMLNESVSDDKKDDEEKDEESKDDEEKAGYTVDTPAISELIDPESAGMSSITPTYVACPPIKDAYVAPEATPTYTAQCPPKPATEKPDAYVAQRPY
jgi:hypothetical protein